MASRTLHNVMPLELIKFVVEFMGISMDDFGGRSRKQSIVIARVLVTYCLLYVGISNTMIGKIILKKHCSVTHYKKLIFDDALVQRKIWEFGEFLSDRDILLPSLESWSDVMSGRYGYDGVIRQYTKNN